MAEVDGTEVDGTVGAERRRGALFALAAWGWWGLSPLFWKQITEVPAAELTAHRVVQGAVLMWVLVGVKGRLRQTFSSGRAIAIHAVAAVLLSINWLVYLYGVETNRVIDASLGYVISPLVMVLFGVVFFHEKMTAVRIVAVGIAGAGVFVLTIDRGMLPWISLVLATSFSLYSLVRKLSPLDAFGGLCIETTLLAPLALGFLGVRASQGTLVVSGVSPLLVFAGLVTVVPLSLFGAALRRADLSTVGLIQYLNPTLQFGLGYFLYGEEISGLRWLGISLIWGALVVFVASQLVTVVMTQILLRRRELLP